MGMDLYKYVRSLDDEIIINNRVDKGRQGMEGVSLSDKFAGDFATPEQQIGRFDTLTTWESCITICKQWAWKPDDEMKSSEECLTTLIKTVAGDGNLLFNVGPMPDGRIEYRQANRLLQMGSWLEKYGMTIYNTRGGPLPPQKWGVMTSNNKNVYLHILNPKSKIVLPGFAPDIRRIHTINDNESLDFKRDGEDVIIKLPKIEHDVIDYILIVELD
jgi:alpha-L-fucosidase